MLIWNSWIQKTSYVDQGRKVRKLVLEEKGNTWDKKCQEIEMYIRGQKCTEAWRFVRNMKAENSSLVILPNQWEEYYKKLLTEQWPKFQQQCHVAIGREPVIVKVKEVEEKIKKLKMEKLGALEE